jgi:hypothetical protein
MNPLVFDGSPEYQAKLSAAAEALEALDPHKRMGSRAFAAHNRMGGSSSVVFPPLQVNPVTSKLQVLLQLRPSTEVWPNCWGLAASGRNADESNEEILVRMAGGLGCQIKTTVPLYGAEWYMSPTISPFPDEHLTDPHNERGSYYHYPYYVELDGAPLAGIRGWQWWDVDDLPDESSWVVHHIRGALFPALNYLKNRVAYDSALQQMRSSLGKC